VPTWFVDDPETFTPPTGRASAHLTVLSEHVSGQELSDIVGLPADELWNRGDLPHARGKFSGYKLSSRLSETSPPGDHLTDLLDRIEPVAPRIRGLLGDQRISSVRLWLVHHIPNWNPGFSISAEQLRRLDELGVGLEIDAYVTE
jgi:hypothetical protein